MNTTESTTIRQDERIPYLLSVVLLVSYSVIIITGILGNLLTIVAILVCEKHRSTQNAYVCNLAISDLFVSISLTPTVVWMLEQEQYRRKEVMLVCQMIGAVAAVLLLLLLVHCIALPVSQ